LADTYARRRKTHLSLRNVQGLRFIALHDLVGQQ